LEQYNSELLERRGLGVVKKLLLGSVVVVALTAAGAANAGAPVAKAADFATDFSNDIIASNNQITLQFVDTYLNYLETGGDYGTAPGPLDSEKGWVPGFGVKASVMKNWLFGNDYLEAEFSRSVGNTGYVGSLLGGVFGSVVMPDGATFTDFDFRWGRGFAVQSNSMITPYVELGYHQWIRAVNLGETYTNEYAGLGVMAQYAPVSRLVLSANGMVGGTFNSHIDVAGPFGFSDSLGNSVLYKLALSSDYAVTKSLHVSASVDYTDFSYGASPLQPSGFFEPHSTTGITTVKVGVGFAY
jgi:hypothetical protein